MVGYISNFGKPVSFPERRSRSVARRRHRPSTVGTPADSAMAKAACSRPHPSSADRARSLSTRAPTMTFIMVLSLLALRQHFHCCTSTARTGHGHSLPLAGRMHHLPVHAASEFGDAAMARSSCGRATISCVCARLGTRTVRERLCDCTVLCVGRARTGHGCQSDRYYSCAGSCAVQATGWPPASAVY